MIPKRFAVSIFLLFCVIGTGESFSFRDFLRFIVDNQQHKCSKETAYAKLDCPCPMNGERCHKETRALCIQNFCRCPPAFPVSRFGICVQERLVSGTVTKSLPFQLESDVTVTFRETLGGPVIQTLTTDSNGFWTTSLPNQIYYVEVSKSGFYTSSFVISATPDVGTLADQNAAITALIPVGVTSIVVTWRSLEDFDLHTTGPDGAGGRFHVYYGNRGSTSASPFTLLNNDDSAFGPEDTTIQVQNVGVYRFSVHDISQSGSTSSMALSNSGAKVEVFRGGQAQPTVFDVPANRGGNVWVVFEMNGNTITPINTFYYQSDANQIT